MDLKLDALNTIIKMPTIENAPLLPKIRRKNATKLSPWCNLNIIVRAVWGPPAHFLRWGRVWFRLKPSHAHFSLSFPRWQRRSETRQVSSFWLLRVKVIEIPEPWGPCSASSTWCLSSTFYSGYVVLRSSSTPVCVRVRNSFFGEPLSSKCIANI